MDTTYELNGHLFIWNTAKATTNWRKHGVSFKEAATVFFDPLFVLTDATRDAEMRYAAIGFDITGRLLYVVHIEINAAFIRIISARRAEPKEEKLYVI